MSSTQDIGAEILQSAQVSFRTQKDWADKAIVQVADEKLHVALHAETNSMAVIMKHVAGNLLSRWTDFLTTDGEKPWRNRDDEFVDAFRTRTELVDHWNRGWQCVLDALERLEPADLAKSVTIRGQPHSVPLAIHRSLAHSSYHVGQIIMIARVVAEGEWRTITIKRGGSADFNGRVWGKGHYGTK